MQIHIPRKIFRDIMHIIMRMYTMFMQMGLKLEMFVSCMGLMDVWIHSYQGAGNQLLSVRAGH